MINLLPPQQKKELKEKGNFKLLLISGIFIFVFLIYLSLILLAVRVYIAGEANTQRVFFAQKEEEINTPQIKALEDNLAAFNKTILKLDSFYQGQVSFGDVLGKITNIVPKDIYLTNVTISRLSCNISGFASSRETLQNFKKDIEKEKSFGGVYFPITDWLTPENFTASFKIK